jgi:DNA-binding MarR family transcriptional regulator/GNAT superfamily N-acetyltransferase
MNARPTEDHVAAVRHFNRFYTRHVGALDEGLLGTPFTLAQARVLYELGTRPVATASDIATALDMDAGYLSRILRRFSQSRLITRSRADDDGRRVLLSLSARGRRVFENLDRRSHESIASLLATLPPSRRERLVSAMTRVHEVLAPGRAAEPRQVVIRAPRVGDIGWAIEAHGRLYAEEFALNEEFEALVASLFAKFASRHDPEFERMWVAEVDGERAGCVFVVRNDDDPSAAQLRCLLVDPSARGLGIGRRLVDECLRFAREAGYRSMVLWTNDILTSARRIYEAAGFQLVKEERHHSFGHDLVGQIWRRDL